MSKYFFYYIFFSFLFSGMIQHSHVNSTVSNSPIDIEVLINTKLDNIKKVTLLYQSHLRQPQISDLFCLIVGIGKVATMASGAAALLALSLSGGPGCDFLNCIQTTNKLDV